MSTPHWRRALVATAIAAPLLIAPATAMPADDAARTSVITTATDRNDTEGPLDVRLVKHRIATHADRTTLAFTVRTWRSFDNADLSRRQRHFVIELDRDGKPGAERNVTIFDRDGGLRADLISNATREVIAHLTAVRINPRTVGVVGPRRLLGVRRVFWTSNYHRIGAPGCGWAGGYPITCQDTVPDRGWLRLDRRAWPAAQQSS
jgi:hypothetical protein